MKDRSIPRHDRRRASAVTTSGWFVDYGDKVILRDRWGNTWSVESTTIMQGSFGFDADGFEKLPRPWKYDSNGKVVIRGDVVVVDFLDGNPKLPLVRGGARRATKDDFLARNHADTSSPYNRLRARLRALDANGNVKGEVRLRVNESETGHAALEATDTIQLFVGDDLDGNTGITLTISNGEVVVAAGGAVERVPLGDTFVADVGALGAEVATLIAFVQSLGYPDAPDASATIAANASASALNGGPYLSNRTKTE